MNDSPGWASPGSSPSEGDRPEPAAPAAGQDGTPAPEDASAAPGPRWSKEQPPPGQWSAPAPDGTGTPGPAQGPAPQPPAPDAGRGWARSGTPQQGWGTPYPNGPQAGGWGAPPAAKPGIIPLRPLAVGEILDGAVTTMRRYWRTVLGISLALGIVAQLVITLIQGFALDGTAPAAEPGDVDAALDQMQASLASSGLAAAVTLLGTVVATAMLTMVFSRAVLGKPSDIGTVWREARPRLLPLFGMTLLLALMVVAVIGVGLLPGLLTQSLGLAFLGGAIGVGVATWLWIRFALASPALMLEKQGIGKALGRSAKLVNGSWWRIFGISVLAQIMISIVQGIIVLPFSLIGMVVSGDGISGFVNGTGELGWAFLIIAGIGSVIAFTVTLPITAGVTVLLYIDQRIRREALDLELARAAGLENYGGPGPHPGTTGS
ncbi:hypothetical protein [Streptomyces sp. NPDC097619]|uniref:DUF7544 domain-containing protein n=1 Tax=Streptomyces sp. NPDC097619 TaxID=3157228 RepID=UPI00332A23E7